MKKSYSINNYTKQKLKKNNKRKLSSQNWLKRHLNDVYVAAAKKEGYYSRAAYKLIEINDKYKIIKRGSKVVDLGAAPGGWSQVVSNIIFKKQGAKLIAIDLLPLNEVKNANIIRGDFTDKEKVEEIKEILQGKANIVLSDMSPNTTGSKSTDHIRIMNLVELAFIFAIENLEKEGHFVAKIFQGGTEAKLLAEIKKRFKKVVHFKPPASRKQSNEIYLIAQGFKG